MITFLDVERLVDTFLAELPEGAFPEDRADGPDEASRSISSSEIRSMMSLVADAYSNLQEIYEDKFPSLSMTVTGLKRWEKQVFSDAVDETLPLAQRVNAVLAKIRFSGGISFQMIDEIVGNYLDQFGLAHQIVDWNGTFDGAWTLEANSTLEADTYLSACDPIRGARRDETPLDCSLDYAGAGITLAMEQEIQQTAYTYEVRILGVASVDILAALDRLLTQVEPARSTHFINNNFTPP